MTFAMKNPERSTPYNRAGTVHHLGLRTLLGQLRLGVVSKEKDQHRYGVLLG
jgi:hypothetical protein